MLRDPGEFRLNYSGSSMNPTFITSDYLQVIPYQMERIRPGDVIVFRPPGEDRKIVHRVVAVGLTGIRTRGDNNKGMDPWVLKPDNILGRVVYVQKGRRWRKVFGGLTGQIFAMNARAYRRIDALISLLLHPVYDWLARKGPFGRLFKGTFKVRILSFERLEGKELQLIWRDQVIGRRLPGKNPWQIRRPYRLMVDESTLPGNLDR